MNTSRLMRNLTGVALALLLLLPVPALGLTFLGSWNFFSSTTGGLAPTDVVQNTSTGSVDNPNNYSLSIGMGNVLNPASTITKYSVTATRDFQITNPSELVKIAHTFATTISSGSINVTLSVQRYGSSGDPFNFPPYSVSAGAVPLNASLDNFFRTGTLNQGLYRLSLTITYTRKSPGTWNNVSPHTFTFQGL